jgi:UrcA family protein
MTTTFRIVRATTVAAFGLLVFAPAAQASDNSMERTVERSVEIDVSKVDFTSPRAVDRLITRVHRVAIDICMGDTRYELVTDAEQRACFDKAVKGGLAQIAGKRQQAMRASAVHVATAATAP